MLREFINNLKALNTALQQLLKIERITIRYPEEYRDFSNCEFRGIIINDRDRCVGCGLCVKICPSRAVDMRFTIGSKTYPGIDYARCIFCGLCIDACPTGALKALPIHDVAVYKLSELLAKPEELLQMSYVDKLVSTNREVYMVKYVFTSREVRKIRIGKIRLRDYINSKKE